MRSRVTIVLAASITLASCAGSGTTPSATGAPRSRGAEHTANVAFTLKIPAEKASSARRRDYVSQATQSATLAIDGTLALSFNTSAATNPNCVTSGTATTCTATIAAQIGTDTFTLSTYDAVLGTSGTPAGNLLSQGTLAQTIAPGAANAVNVILNGVAASLGVGAPSNTLAVGTAGTTPIVVTAYDADGFAIVGPGSAFINAAGQPVTVTLSDVDPGGTTSLATGAISPQASTATLTYNGTPPLGRYPTVTASANGLASAQTVVPISPSFAYIDAGTATSPTGIVPTTAGSLLAPEETCTSGKCQALLAILAPSGALHQTPSQQMLPSGVNVDQIATDSDGRAYFGLNGNGAGFIIYDPTTGTYSNEAIAPAGFSSVTTNGIVATGADGRIWEIGSGETTSKTSTCFLAATTAAGSVTAYPFTTSNSCGDAVMLPGSDARLWFLGNETLPATIYAATTSGVVSTYALPTGAIGGSSYRVPLDMTNGIDGNLYIATTIQRSNMVAEGTATGCEILKIAPNSGAVTELTANSALSSQQGHFCVGPIVTGAYGDLWFLLGDELETAVGPDTEETFVTLARADTNGNVTVFPNTTMYLDLRYGDESGFPDGQVGFAAQTTRSSDGSIYFIGQGPASGTPAPPQGFGFWFLRMVY